MRENEGHVDPPEPDPPSKAPSPASRRAHVEALLAEPDPRVLVNRLIDEDPLDVVERVRGRLRERALFVSPVQAFLHAVGRLALTARHRTEETDLDAWVDAAVDVTIDSLLQEQREEEAHRRPVEDPEDVAYYGELAALFQVPASDARRACLALNDLPELARRTFHAVVVRGLEAEAWAAEQGLRPELVRRTLQDVSIQVLEAIHERRSRGRGPG